MKKTLRFLVSICCVSALVACSDKPQAPAKAPAPPATAPQAGAPAGGAPTAPATGAVPPGAMEQHPPIEKAAVDASAPKAGSIQKAGNGTVLDIFAKKAELSGKKVSFRGKVMKFSPMIMGKNWLHIQDGTGEASAGTNDVTVTSAQTASVGDTVLVTGTLQTNRDFGAGYSYALIVEDAELKVEKK